MHMAIPAALEAGIKSIEPGRGRKVGVDLHAKERITETGSKTGPCWTYRSLISASGLRLH